MMQLLVSMHVCVQENGHTLLAVSVLGHVYRLIKLFLLTNEWILLNKVGRIEEVNV